MGISLRQLERAFRVFGSLSFDICFLACRQSNMATIRSHASHAWWKEAVVYQIYPASFLSTGSGTAPGWGDIKGITSKVDYLKHLGVDVVWLSPIYKSPQVDMGYDISDYEDIDPRYGSLEDVDELIKELKKRDMKLMMFVAVPSKLVYQVC